MFEQTHAALNTATHSRDVLHAVSIMGKDSERVDWIIWISAVNLENRQKCSSRSSSGHGKLVENLPFPFPYSTRSSQFHHQTRSFLVYSSHSPLGKQHCLRLRGFIFIIRTVCVSNMRRKFREESLRRRRRDRWDRCRCIFISPIKKKHIQLSLISFRLKPNLSSTAEAVSSCHAISSLHPSTVSEGFHLGSLVLLWSHRQILVILWFFLN